MSKVNVYDGVAGFGKTKRIVKNIKNYDYVMCLTKEGVSNIIDRLMPDQHPKVITIERFNTLNIKPGVKLAIDEAGLIDIYQASKMLNANIVEQVDIFGDSLQNTKTLYTESMFKNPPIPLIKIKESKRNYKSERFTPEYAAIIQRITGVEIEGVGLDKDKQTLCTVVEQNSNKFYDNIKRLQPGSLIITF